MVDSKSLASQFVITPLVWLKLTEGHSLALTEGAVTEVYFPTESSSPAFKIRIPASNTEKYSYIQETEETGVGAGWCVAGPGEGLAAGPAAVESFPRSALFSCLCHFLPLARTRTQSWASAVVTTPERGSAGRFGPAEIPNFGVFNLCERRGAPNTHHMGQVHREALISLLSLQTRSFAIS